MGIGDLDESAAHLVGIDGAGGVVGIDDDEGAGLRGDGAADIVEVGQPAVGVVGAVVDRGGTDLGEHRGVEGIRGRGHEHLFPLVDDGGEGQFDAFGGARGDEHAVRVGWHAAAGEVVGDRLAGFQNAGGGRVSIVAVAHRLGHGFDEMRRRQEAELIGVADVQVADAGAGGFDLPGLGHDVADGVGEAVDALSRADGS